MKFRTRILILTGCLFSSTCALSPGELRNLFEWGEYQQLIDVLEPYFTTAPDTLAPSLCGEYHCYLGVAYFGKGRAGEAQKQFLAALSHDSAVAPDREYISGEINDFFMATRSDFVEAKDHARAGDSLLAVKQVAIDNNLKAMQREEQRKNKRDYSLLAVSFIALGAAFAAGAGYEYYSTAAAYDDFKAAAAAGDRLTYDRLRPGIRKSNGIIVGCIVAAGLSEAAGIKFTIRSLRRR
jgi:hypothetical protein